jgi:chaperone required for assembly of F1-ATPase
MDTSTVIDVKKYLQTDLFDELGMDMLTAEERVKFLDEMGTVLQRRAMIRVWDELTEEQKDEMDRIAKASEKAPNAVLQYVAGVLPNLENLIQEEIAGYKKELMELFKATQG